MISAARGHRDSRALVAGVGALLGFRGQQEAMRQAMLAQLSAKEARSAEKQALEARDQALRNQSLSLSFLSPHRPSVARASRGNSCWRQRWLTDDRNPELLLPSGKRLAEGEELLLSRREEVDAQIAEYIEASSCEQQEKEVKDRQAERAALVEAAEAANAND